MFYTYEHTRNDTGATFYVGKGKGRRCTEKSGRNQYWERIVLKAGGFKVRKLIDNIEEELALLIECERITQLKEAGVKLANLTGGGEGISGYVHTEEARAKITSHSRAVVSKLKAEGKPHWMQGTKLPLETRRRIAEANIGKKHTEEAKRCMSENHRHTPHSIETLEKMSKASRATQAKLKAEGKPHWNCGITRSEETRQKIRESTTGKHWYNNGITERLCMPESVPDTFTRGRIIKCHI